MAAPLRRAFSPCGSIRSRSQSDAFVSLDSTSSRLLSPPGSWAPGSGWSRWGAATPATVRSTVTRFCSSGPARHSVDAGGPDHDGGRQASRAGRVYPRDRPHVSTVSERSSRRSEAPCRLDCCEGQHGRRGGCPDVILPGQRWGRSATPGPASPDLAEGWRHLAVGPGARRSIDARREWRPRPLPSAAILPERLLTLPGANPSLGEEA
jgi:hypothetical protein